MNVNPIEKISQELTDMILSETFLNKNTLQPRIASLLRVFYNKMLLMPKKPDDPAKTNEYRMTIHRITLESSYWRNLVKDVSSAEQMQEHYKNVDALKRD